MDKNTILTMEAEELRRKVGEDVFGYTVEARKGFYIEDGSFIEFPDAKGNDEYALCYADRWNDKSGKEVLIWEELPDYPNDISAAFQVLKKLQEKWRWITLFCDSGLWFITLENPNEMEVKRVRTEIGSELAEAISKVALLASLEGG